MEDFIMKEFWTTIQFVFAGVGGWLRHCFAGGGATEQETVGATSSDIAGLVSRLEYSR